MFKPSYKDIMGTCPYGTRDSGVWALLAAIMTVRVGRAKGCISCVCRGGIFCGLA
jgi:hypothetical protein